MTFDGFSYISQAQRKPARGATNSTSEFDEILDMLEPDDVDELAGNVLSTVLMRVCL